jgi:hypothetical protein
MSKVMCPGCAIVANPPPRSDFAYIAAVTEIKFFGIEKVMSELCILHRSLFDDGTSTLQKFEKRKR